MTTSYPLWTDERPFPDRTELSSPAGASDTIVHRAGADGYGFLHDAAIVAHKNVLTAAWYNCPEKEIEGESCIRRRVSRDAGATWSEVETVVADREGRGVFYVPAVFLSHQGSLFAFISNMVSHDVVTQCEVFVLDEGLPGTWQSCGSLGSPFLPNCAPVRMEDGNFAMAGRVAHRPGAKPLTPAIAISLGGDVAAPWRISSIFSGGLLPGGTRLPYPETTLMVEPGELTAIVRNDQGNALLFVSRDCARSWSGPFRHNFPIGAAKMYAGVLSTGQRFLVSNRVTEDYRDVLTLALSPPGEKSFCRLWKLRDGHAASIDAGPEWSYPCAIEHGKHLYVVYTSEKRHCALTVVPMESLRVDD